MGHWNGQGVFRVSLQEHKGQKRKMIISHQTKELLLKKVTINIPSTQHIIMEKIFANYNYDMELISGIYQEQKKNLK